MPPLNKNHIGKSRDEIIDDLMSEQGGSWPLSLIFDYLRRCFDVDEEWRSNKRNRFH